MPFTILEVQLSPGVIKMPLLCTVEVWVLDIVCGWWDRESYLLSCRIMKRSVEQAVLSHTTLPAPSQLTKIHSHRQAHAYACIASTHTHPPLVTISWEPARHAAISVMWLAEKACDLAASMARILSRQSTAMSQPGPAKVHSGRVWIVVLAGQMCGPGSSRGRITRGAAESRKGPAPLGNCPVMTSYRSFLSHLQAQWTLMARKTHYFWSLGWESTAYALCHQLCNCLWIVLHAHSSNSTVQASVWMSKQNMHCLQLDDSFSK